MKVTADALVTQRLTQVRRQSCNTPRFCAASSASRLRINSCAFSFFSRASRAAFSFAVSAGFSALLQYHNTACMSQQLTK